MDSQMPSYTAAGVLEPPMADTRVTKTDPFSPNDRLFIGAHRGRIVDVLWAMDLAHVVSDNDEVRVPFNPSGFSFSEQELEEGRAVRFKINRLGHVVDLKLVA